MNPNIVFILIDDMGWRDLHCYGSDFYETPNIDSLAAGGMIFSQAYAACPVCSPTRASIMSGQYPARIGLTNYIGGSEHPSRGKLIDAPYVDHLPLEITSLASTLKKGHYQTWHVGKWHLGNEPFYPDNHGFDINIGGCHYGQPAYGYFSPYHIPTLLEGPDGEFLTDRLTSEAIHLINTRDNSKPFYLNLWYYDVHNPLQAPRDEIDYFIEKAHRLGLDTINPFEIGERFPTTMKNQKHILRRKIQSNPVYAAMIHRLDANIGKLLNTLEENNILENTLVIFTSDNGGLSTSEGSPTSNLPLSEGKGWMYEGGIREPMIASWRGVIPEGSQCDVPITSPDFYPTFAEIAGAVMPENQIFDGISFLPLLRGDHELPRESIFWHYPHYGNQGGRPAASILKKNLKLIHFFEDGHDELFDLPNDIAEENDLSESKPESAFELRLELMHWLDSIEASLPERNQDYEEYRSVQPSAPQPISQFDLETPLGILLYNLEAKGLLTDLGLDIECLNDRNFLVSHTDDSLYQLEYLLDIPLEEVAKRLQQIANPAINK